VKFILFFLIAAKRIQNKEVMNTIERNKVRVAYHLEGDGNITLFFVHGAFINRKYWSEQIEFFKKDYTVVALDLPGHGESGKNRTDWSIQAYGDDVCTLIEALHLKNVILIGHSMGGDVILEAAVENAQNIIGFVAIDMFKNAGTPMPDEIQLQVGDILDRLKTDFAATSEFFARSVLLSNETDHAITERVAADYRMMDKDIGFELISSTFNYYSRERMLMGRLKNKMYLINVDNVPTREELLNKYAASGYTLVPIKGTCHYPMIENPGEFNCLLKKVITDITLAFRMPS
jgi:sigma-B regulation protein RsbQ